MSTALSLNRYQHRIGDDETLTIPLYDASGDAVDCSSGTMTLSCRAYEGSSTETFDDSTSGVTVTGTTTGITLAFTEAALSSVSPGTYVFNVSRTDSNVTTSYPIGGSFILDLLPQIR